MIPMIQALLAEATQLVSVLKGAGPLKPSKASKKTAKLDENGEPKEKRAVRPDSYIHLLHKVVSPALTAMAEVTEDEAEKKMLKSVTARAQIAKALYETVKAITNEDKTIESEMRATAIMEISKESVADAFQAWKADPPAVEYKGKKAAKAAAAAAVATVTDAAAEAVAPAAAAPKVVKPKVVKPKVEKVAKPVLSEEEKAAKKKAAAKAAYEKSKIKKAAEKAAATAAPAVSAAPADAPAAAGAAAGAAPAIVAAPASAVTAVEEVSCDPYIWEHNFGKGNLAYERIDFDGVAYIYEADTKTYLGVFQETTNSLDLSIPDPTAE